MGFRLDAVDAYERKLVKQIEVASATVEDAHNKPFVRLVSVSSKRGTVSAKVELDVGTASGVKRQEVTVCDGDDLEQAAKRAIYADFRIGEINTAKDEEFLELRYPGGEAYLALGQAHGDVDALAVQRQMIRRTIKEHLDKEKRLRPLGIKVLSLFFIDAVDRYRQYDADGNPVKGDYARIFEEEYRRAAKLPAYQSLFAEIDWASAAEEVHNGYFSIDKKGGWTDTSESNAGSRENAERAYNLIMKEKEKLLGFETPLKFIFSHSALKEGWDNPNVFQICTLRDIQTERERRQTIGRGLRLAVNQHGERVRGFEVNTLTVIATENYEQFAENLQKEIEADTGVRFGIVEQHQFAAIAVTSADGQTVPLGIDQSKVLWEHLKAVGHIDAKGKVQDSLKTALKNGTLALPAEFDAQRGQIAEVLRKVSGRLEIKNADERKQVPVRKAIYLSVEFKALWDRIKHQTTYRVQFDNAKLVSDCIAALQEAPAIAKARLQWRKADIAIGKAGVEATEKAGAATIVLDETDIELPDLLTDLQDRTQLTRRTITSILTGSGRLDDFKRNPHQFIELAAETVNRCKRLALVDGIKYQKLGDEHFYAQELFDQEELTGYLKNMLMDTEKSIYEHVVYDSSTERDFADALEKNDAIKLYAKLPGWFKVPTPLGSYNPDWAVLVEQDDTQRLYFVVETKSSLYTDDLRNKESANIACGKAHFHALAVGENPARYVVARFVADVLKNAQDGAT
jgi:type III restriction enzyme